MEISVPSGNCGQGFSSCWVMVLSSPAAPVRLISCISRGGKSTHPCTHSHTHTQTHTRRHTHAHTHACTHARTHAHTHTHTYAHTHAHTHTHTRTDLVRHGRRVGARDLVKRSLAHSAQGLAHISSNRLHLRPCTRTHSSDPSSLRMEV